MGVDSLSSVWKSPTLSPTDGMERTCLRMMFFDLAHLSVLILAVSACFTRSKPSGTANAFSYTSDVKLKIRVGHFQKIENVGGHLVNFQNVKTHAPIWTSFSSRWGLSAYVEAHFSQNKLLNVNFANIPFWPDLTSCLLFLTERHRKPVKIYAEASILRKHACGGTKCGGSLKSVCLCVCQAYTSLPGHFGVIVMSVGQHGPSPGRIILAFHQTNATKWPVYRFYKP